MPVMAENWHALSSTDTLTRLESRASGLTEAEAKERLSKFGANTLEEKAGKSPVLRFLSQFASPLVYVLLAAAAVSAFTGHPVDTLTILGVLLANAVIGYIQESKAEKAMAALREMAAPRAKVRRAGKLRDITAADLVPGDVIIIEEGDRVPADARLLELAGLRVNESSLTGESEPVEKALGALRAEVTVGDRTNMVFQSTAATQGKAVAVVAATGMNTELGRIAGSLSGITEEKTPLQKGIARLSNYLVIILLAVCGLILGVGLIRGLEPVEMFLLAVAAAVSAIPEGLPAVVTVVLAIGMRMMAQRNAIIRKLVAVETLGSATIICSDKTGTLTLNQMTMRQLYADGRSVDITGEGYRPDGEFQEDGKVIAADDETLRLALRIGALCNNATVTTGQECCSLFGDPTEGALLVAAAKAGLFKEDLDKEYRRLDEIPFSSERQYMATLNDAGKVHITHAKGAAEKLLGMCSHIYNGGRPVALDEAARHGVRRQIETMAGQAMRVLALAYAELPTTVTRLEEEHISGKLVLAGLAGIADPPRPEAREAVAAAQGAGIRVVMITGDHAATAQAIAREVGIGGGRAMTGADVAALSDAELAAAVKDVSVFARIEPLQKLRIVRAWKSQGEVVAVTGDGVNDAPALKAADIGVAMGKSGTDVAREAADMVLADDNFASVVAAVEEGRGIFNRLRAVIYFLLASNIGELMALAAAIAILGDAPLLAAQILWINVVTDATITVPLAMEPRRGDELKSPPRSPEVSIIYPGLMWRVGYTALIMAAVVFGIFYWAEQHFTVEEARTLVFCTVVSFELWKGFIARSDELPAIKIGFFSNRWLLLAIGIAVLLQLAAVYLPFLQAAFRTVPPTPQMWAIAVGAGFSIFAVEELRKIFFPRLFSRGKWRRGE
ncbi:ATPase [Dehalogenimonas alkenigignens]|nr:ATPase [Dehalogenimonas alkenigignens]